jgi:hypothetical protein
MNNEFVEEYQCPGCMGCDNEYSKKRNNSLTCSKHYPGTMMPGVGKILLGMPKGFNRMGPIEDFKRMGFEIYSTYDDFIKDYKNIQTKYCVPDRKSVV